MALTSHWSGTTISVKDVRSNSALNLAPFGRWTLHDKAAQCRLALSWAYNVVRSCNE